MGPASQKGVPFPGVPGNSLSKTLRSKCPNSTTKDWYGGDGVEVPTIGFQPWGFPVFGDPKKKGWFFNGTPVAQDSKLSDFLKMDDLIRPKIYCLFWYSVFFFVAKFFTRSIGAPLFFLQVGRKGKGSSSNHSRVGFFGIGVIENLCPQIPLLSGQNTPCKDPFFGVVHFHVIQNAATDWHLLEEILRQIPNFQVGQKEDVTYSYPIPLHWILTLKIWNLC